MAAWKRIPLPIAEESDRRTLVGILTSNGLEVRVVRIKPTNKGTPLRYVEYRDTGIDKPVVLRKTEE